MRRVWWLGFLLLGFGCQGHETTEEARLAAEGSPVAPGVVVEVVPEGTALYKAGIRPGDILLSWKRLANPPANPEPAEGELLSPFDFHHLRLEQAPRGVVEIVGERDGVGKLWAVESGSWRVAEVQPRWVREYADLFRKGKRLIAERKVEKGVVVWGQLRRLLQRERSNRAKLWVDFELIKRSLMEVGDSREMPASVGGDIGSTRVARDIASAKAYVYQEAGNMSEEGGDFVQALELYNLSLVTRRALDSDTLVVAYSLNDLGILARRQGRLGEAESLFNSSLEIRKKYAPGSLLVATSLNNLGSVYSGLGNLDKAEDFYRRSLQITQRLAPNSQQEATALNNLGLITMRRGNQEQAEEYYSRALQLLERFVPETTEVAACLTNLGLLASNRGDFDKASELYKRALRIREKIAPNSLGVGNILNNLGILASDRGDIQSAQELFLRSLRLKEEFAPESLNVALTLNNLADLEAEQGHFYRAEGIYRRALRIREEHSSKSIDVAVSLQNLGFLAMDRGDLGLAEDLLTRAREILRKVAPLGLERAAGDFGMGVIYQDQGELDKAREHFDHAQQIYETLAPQGPDIALCLQARGDLARVAGDFNEAKELLSRALVIAGDSSPGSLTVASILTRLGILAAEQGRFREAQKFQRSALHLRRTLAPRSFHTADSLNHLGDIAQSLGRPEAASEKYLAAIDILEGQVGYLGGSYGTQASFRSQQKAFYLDALSSFLSQGRFDEAFSVAERFRGRTFLLMVAERDIVFGSDIPETLDQERRSLSARYDRALRQLVHPGGHDAVKGIAAAQVDLQHIQRARAEIEESIRRASPRLAALQYPESLTANQAQRVLDPGTLMLSYIVTKEFTIILALSRGRSLEVRVSRIGEAALRQMVGNLRGVIPNTMLTGDLAEEHKRDFRNLSQELFRLLAEPVADRIGESRRLLIVPDGPLHALPFGVLQDEQQYLVEWKPIHIGLSMTAYAELKKDRPTTQAPRVLRTQLAAFGDPSYPAAFTLSTAEDRSAALPEDAVLRSVSERDGLSFHWQPVPYTRREVEGIASVFPEGRSQVYLGPEAIEERVKDLGDSPRILHLAAHAFVDDHIPLNSGIVLSIPEDLPEGRDNGILQAWEILEQVRINADLVVLSGCVTGMGKELRGEGLIGLTRAFQYAGARSLVSTLWNVNDQATAELMIRFYRHLAAGLPKDEALRAAQIEMIHEPIFSVDSNGQPQELKDASAPYYWAGVQLYGDWQ
jgi:CHAT domain-containing protein/Tfp pilus assembly protein PilF